MTVTLTNHGSSVATMVVVSLRDRFTGERILPTIYSDNYLWLLPGERREVTLSWLRSGRGVSPQVYVNGYNLPVQAPPGGGTSLAPVP